MKFPEIPNEVLEYVRRIFSDANDKVSKALTLQPAIYEETLDHILVSNLSAEPAVFFDKSQVALDIESHWLGSRHMYGRWEIADVALFVSAQISGRTISRKVALLQAKRLYSREIPSRELEPADYVIGIGRLLRFQETGVPLSRPRVFNFGKECVFGALSSGSDQIKRIDNYQDEVNIPVYYNFYCPTELPVSLVHPASPNDSENLKNNFGVRVMNADDVHSITNAQPYGSTAKLKDFLANNESVFGDSLEAFVCDKLLQCKAGRLFGNSLEKDLEKLLSRRSNPISAAISITIDFAEEPHVWLEPKP